MTHHPHVHMIVTGGVISPDGSRWIASRPDYLVPVEVLSSLFRGRMLGMLSKAHATGRLEFFGDCQHLADTAAFKAYLAPLWKTDWFVYAKRPFAGPQQVLAYLSRYTHRVAISNSRLISADAGGVTFKYKNYRIEGPDRYKTMTLEPGEFIRRFLIHVLPKGFHRIRHYGLLTNGAGTRAEKLARARQLIAAAPKIAPSPQSPHDHRDLRAGSSSSPSPLGAGDRHRNQYVMMPDSLATIPLSPARSRRPQWRSAVVTFSHAISYAIGRPISQPFPQSTPSTRRRGTVLTHYPAPFE